MVEDIELWRKAGKAGARALALGGSLIRPGGSIIEVAEAIEKSIRGDGCEPSFPVNISVNVEAAHFTPPPGYEKRFSEGDLVKLDVGAHIKGCISDNAMTVEVGTSRRSNLIAATVDALEAAEASLHGGMYTTMVSDAIERAIHRKGFKPVVNLMGHNIERYLLHAGKSVPNTTALHASFLDEGIVVAVEPFATNGQGRIEDGPFGNIMRFRSEPDKDREPEMGELYKRFSTLPFCARWIDDTAVRKALSRTKGRLLQTYPVFVEAGKGLVSQAEKTFLLYADRAELLTTNA